MKRRKFLKNASVAGGATAVAASTFPAPAISQSRIRWNAVSAFGKAGLLGQALEEFTRFVNTASEGKLTIKAYHAGELVKPFEAMDAVQSGAAQMGYGAPYYWAGKSDSISFVAAMPYGLTAQEQNAWLYYGKGIEQADQYAYNPLGLKFLPMGNSGNQMGGWYAKEINTVNDLKGLKFRIEYQPARRAIDYPDRRPNPFNHSIKNFLCTGALFSGDIEKLIFGESKSLLNFCGNSGRFGLGLFGIYAARGPSFLPAGAF